MSSEFSLREWLAERDLTIVRTHGEGNTRTIWPLKDDAVDRLQGELEEAQVAAIMKGPTGDRVRELWREADEDEEPPRVRAARELAAEFGTDVEEWLI